MSGAAAARDDAADADGVEGADDPERPGKTERILNLVSFLLKERRPVPFRSILGRVVGYDDDGTETRALERRFERDKIALREMGVHIAYVAAAGAGGADGYVLRPQDCFLDRIEVLPHETALLNLVSEIAVRRGGEAVSGDLMTAIQKLRFDTPVPAGLEVGASSTSTSPVPSAWERSLLELDLATGLRNEPNLEGLLAACLKRQRVAFAYYAIGHDETRRREVAPYGLGFAGGAWYLAGFDEERRANRCYRLDRVKGAVEPAGPEGAFTVPAGFKVEDHIHGKVAGWRLGAEAAPAGEVALEVQPAIAWFVEDLLAASPEAIEERPDGSALVRVNVRDPGAFLRWTLGHLRHVRIAEPATLRADLEATIRAIRDRYAEDVPAGGMPAPPVRRSARRAKGAGRAAGGSKGGGRRGGKRSPPGGPQP